MTTTAQSALASRMASVRPSATATVSDEARLLRANGRSIVNLGEGELDFATPPAISAAGIAAIQSGDTKYTSVTGTLDLKEAIRNKFRRENALDYSLDEIIAACGAKQIIYNAFQATVDRGDEVVVPAPYWVSYPDMVALADGNSVIVKTDADAGFKLTPEQLEAALSPRTKWLLLNSPSNPTGALYSAEELKALAEVIRKHPTVMVLSDDIYEHIVYEGSFSSFATVAPDLRDRTLTVNGVSKCFSMTGWRLGYAGGPQWLVDALGVLQSQSTSNPSSISQAAAVEALNGDTKYLSDWMVTLRERRDIVLAAIERTDGVLKAAAPASAFYIYADCSGAMGRLTPTGARVSSDVCMASYLLSEAGVAIVPGAAFGLSPYFRIAYAIDTAQLHGACEAMVAACQALRPEAA